jgi:hypothetical protein
MPGKVVSGSGIGHNRKRLECDGINNVFTITHNLGTQLLIVQIWDELTLEQVIVDVDADTVDTVVLTFAVVPTNDKIYLIHILGHMDNFT